MLSRPNFNVDIVHARLWSRMVRTGMPLAWPCAYTAQAFDGKATPVLGRVWNDGATTTRATELIEKRLLSTTLCTNDMWAHLAHVSVISSNNL